MTCTSEPPKTDASISTLMMGAKCARAANRPMVAREELIRALKLWVDENCLLGQGDFWRLYRRIKNPEIFLPTSVGIQYCNWTVNLGLQDFSNLDFEYAVNLGNWADHFAFHRSVLDESSVTFDDEHQGFVIDGLQRLQAVSLLDFSQEISAKSARQAILDTLAEIERFSDEQTVYDFFKLVISTLSEKILASVKLVVRFRGVRALRPCNDDTRHRILNFSIHTGNSPPLARRVLRPAIGWALVTLNTNARRVFHGTLQLQRSSRNLRNAVYSRHSRPCDGRGTRNHAHLDLRPQPSGCRSSWVHRSLAKCA